MNYDGLPVFGPSSRQNVHDDQPAPHVAVRVEFLLSRDELLAAFASGYGITNVGGNPDTMTVEEIRYDVEAHLADTSLLDLDDLVQVVARQKSTGVHVEQMQALERALDRAYPLEEPPQPTQNPVYGDGTVTVDTLDHGRVTMSEPAWCEGHEELLVQLRVDTAHIGAETAAEYDGVDFLPVRFSWAPFSQRQPEPMADVAEFPGMGPDGLRCLAAQLAAYSGVLYSKANVLSRIRRRQA